MKKIKALRYIKKHGGWKTRLGFYIVVGSVIFSQFGYGNTDGFVTIGFAFLLLGIGDKLNK